MNYIFHCVPTSAALGFDHVSLGVDTQPGWWPEVTHPTPPAQLTAFPGSGFEIRPVALGEKRGKAVGE